MVLNFWLYVLYSRRPVVHVISNNRVLNIKRIQGITWTTDTIKIVFWSYLLPIGIQFDNIVNGNFEVLKMTNKYLRFYFTVLSFIKYMT